MLEISEKALTLELKEIGRAKSRDDKLHRNHVITQLENIQSKIFYEEDILRHAKPLPRKRDRLKIYWLSRGFGGSASYFPLYAGS